MKLVILLLLVGMIVPVFAQEVSLADNSSQLEHRVIQDNFERIGNKLSDIENKVNYTITKMDVIQNQTSDLNQRLEKTENNSEQNNNNFYESIFLILSPIIVGAFLTQQLSNYWHNYQFKIKIKQEILDLSHNSINNTLNIQDSFIRELTDTYTIDEDLSTVEKSGYTTKQIVFPIDSHKFPVELFQKQYDALRLQLTINRLVRIKLDTQLQLYLNDEAITNDLKTISLKLGIITSKIKKIMKATTSEEFNILDYNDFDEIRQLINTFELKLIKKKIRKINV